MELKGVKNKRMRAALLELLRTEYPGSLDLKALRFSMDSLGYPMTDAMLSAHLRYLEEKGLLRLEVRSGFGFRIRFAYLTAEGWDMLDGLGKDDKKDGGL